MVDVTYAAAAGAGVLSFLSPCVLPLVPPYLCFLAGTTVAEAAVPAASPAVRRDIMLAAAAFVLGLATVFVALGATASALGGLARQVLPYAAEIAGVITIGMGLHFLGLYRIAFMDREKRADVGRPPGLPGAYAMGLAFAFGWTPCIGPVLGAIMFLAGSEATVARGMALLAVYSLGLGIPFLITAYGVERAFALLQRFKRHFRKVEVATGVLLVVTGIGFLGGQNGWVAGASNWLIDTFPVLQQLS